MLRIGVAWETSLPQPFASAQYKIVRVFSGFDFPRLREGRLFEGKGFEIELRIPIKAGTKQV